MSRFGDWVIMYLGNMLSLPFKNNSFALEVTMRDSFQVAAASTASTMRSNSGTSSS